MTKTDIPTEMSNGQRDNTKAPPKWSITQRLRTDLGRSVRVTTATQLVWLIGLLVQRGWNKFLRLSVLSGSKYEGGGDDTCMSVLCGSKFDVVCPPVCFTSIPICMRRCFSIYPAFLDIENSISWYQEMNSWYQEMNSWYQKIFFWYQEIYFDIKKSISWYQEIEFLISSIRFLDIKNSISDIKK